MSPTVQLYPIFVFFLIISSNYLGEIFPCKIQSLLHGNVYLKHIFAFLTLLFFVVFVDPLHTNTLYTTIKNSLFLYGIFLLLINTNVLFFVISMATLAVMYLFNLYKKEAPETVIPWLDTVDNMLYILFAVSTLVGFLVYMGEKKIEYKKRFHYLTFLFGKPSCRGFSPKTKMANSFLHAFQ